MNAWVVVPGERERRIDTGTESAIGRLRAQRGCLHLDATALIRRHGDVTLCGGLIPIQCVDGAHRPGGESAGPVVGTWDTPGCLASRPSIRNSHVKRIELN